MQQWRKTFADVNPLPFVAQGAAHRRRRQDLGNPGPDYTFGFGLVDAKDSVDLIIDDQGTGKRITSRPGRAGRVGRGPVCRDAGPEAPRRPRLVRSRGADRDPDEIAQHALLNDLDLKVVGPDGATTLPYVLNASVADKRGDAAA